MEEYHKIQSVYKRDEKTHRFIEGEWSLPEFSYLQYTGWEFTEKVDGTNIRVSNAEGVVRVGGRTDNAQIPATLVARLQEMFPIEKFEGLPSLTLYGEGYGAKIQKGGGDYIPDGCSFILFDVCIDGWWLRSKDVYDIAAKLGINCVPIIGHGTLHDAIQLCRDGFASKLKSSAPEGLVCRPTVELRDRAGRRIITKIKLKDF